MPQLPIRFKGVLPKGKFSEGKNEEKEGKGGNSKEKKLRLFLLFLIVQNKSIKTGIL